MINRQDADKFLKVWEDNISEDEYELMVDFITGTGDRWYKIADNAKILLESILGLDSIDDGSILECFSDASVRAGYHQAIKEFSVIFGIAQLVLKDLLWDSVNANDRAVRSFTKEETKQLKSIIKTHIKNIERS